MLINKAVIDGVARVQQGQGVELSPTLLAAFVAILDEAELDSALKAEILALPGEATLAELFEVADIDAIHRVRDAIHGQLAEAFGARLLTATYERLRLTGYRVIHADTAKRALKGVVLGYLAALDAEHADALVREQYADRRQHDRHPGGAAGGQQPSAAMPRRTAWPTSRASGPMTAWYWTTGCGWWAASLPPTCWMR